MGQKSVLTDFPLFILEIFEDSICCCNSGLSDTKISFGVHSKTLQIFSSVSKDILLVIQNDIGNLHSSTTIVMPFSTKTYKNPNQPTHTLIRKSADTGLKMDSVLLGEQMRVISNERIKKKIGMVTNKNEQNEIRRVYAANFGE